MLIFSLFLFLFILSVGFTIIMDLVAQLPLSVALRNVQLPFKNMMNEELIFIILIILYVFTKPVFSFFRRKKKQ